MNEQLSLMIVDDHEMFRKGMKKILDSNPWCRICEEAATVDASIPILKTLQPDILLLDIYLRYETTFPRIPEIRKIAPHTKIIMLTVSEEPEDLLQAVHYSVDGYLAKNTPIEKFKEHIYSVYNGTFTVSDTLASALYETLIMVKSAPALTKQESQVLTLVQSGYTNKDIAEQLHISVFTVKNHVSSILRKMNVSRRYQLIKK